MKKFISMFLVLSFSMLITCGSDDEEESMNRIIPPDYTMSVDFSELNQMNPDADNKSAGGLCWLVGATVVTWCNAVCFLPFSIPIAILQVLREHKPTDSSSTHVEWSYSHNNNSATVTADKNGGEYDWEWEVIINDFTWITGGSMENKTEGWWQFHNPEIATDSHNGILVEWAATDSSHFTVQFSNNNTANTDTYGDFILYTRDGDDYSVRIHDIKRGTDNTGTMWDITVYWNISDETGGIAINDENVGSDQPCTWPNE